MGGGQGVGGGMWIWRRGGGRTGCWQRPASPPLLPVAWAMCSGACSRVASVLTATSSSQGRLRVKAPGLRMGAGERGFRV